MPAPNTKKYVTTKAVSDAPRAGAPIGEADSAVRSSPYTVYGCRPTSVTTQPASIAIKPDGSGDVTDTHVAWSNRKGPAIPSPIIRDELLFTVSDRGGIVSCLNAKTGDEIWKKRISGNHWASPIYAGGKLYCTSKTGEVAVMNASREMPEFVSKSRLKAQFIASPAVAGSSLLLRSTSHLYCVASGYQRTEEQVAGDVYPDGKAMAKGKPKAKAKGDGRMMSLKVKLGEMIKSGKLTTEEAVELYNAANGKD